MCSTINVSKGALYLDYNENLPDVSMWENLKDLRQDIPIIDGYKAEWNYVKDAFGWTKRELNLYLENVNMTDELLEVEIAKGHKRHFIGKVGKFCPIIPGYGGAELVCLNEQGKYVAPSGTKDIRWLESSYVQSSHMEDKIDYGYYDKLVQDAINDIEAYDTEFIE